MQKEFIPNINKKRFVRIVSEIPGFEGNVELSREVMKSKISDCTDFSYEKFMDICRAYHIDVQFSEITGGDKDYFKVIIRHNKIEDQSMSYDDRNKDITEDLARGLFSVLSVQLQNEMFINDLKK